MSSFLEQPADEASISDQKGEHMAAGKRVFRDVSETTKKLTVLVPVEMDEQLRRVAARSGKNVGALVRGWIEKALKETVW